MYVCMCVCVDVRMCGCVDVWMCGCVDVCMCGCVDVWMCGCVFVCMFVCMYMYVYMYVYVCIYVHGPHMGRILILGNSPNHTWFWRLMYCHQPHVLPETGGKPPFYFWPSINAEHGFTNDGSFWGTVLLSSNNWVQISCVVPLITKNQFNNRMRQRFPGLILLHYHNICWHDMTRPSQMRMQPINCSKNEYL